jgi:hypothetical protein
MRLAASILLLFTIAAPAAGQTFDDLIAEAGSLYQQGLYEESGTHYELAFALEDGSPTHYYNAACAWSLAGDAEKAFAMLTLASDKGFRNTELLMADSDLAPLHNDPRWDSAVSRCQTAEALWLTSINIELYRLFQSDQADRSGEGDWENMEERDRQRRKLVAKMIEDDKLHAPDDFVHAAFIFQHGADSTSYRTAHELAMKAVELDSTYMRARWIAAASKDRYLQSTGKPQIYGTQLLKRNGEWTLQPYDTTAVTDAERASWGVPPLARQLKWEAEANGRE